MVRVSVRLESEILEPTSKLRILGTFRKTPTPMSRRQHILRAIQAARYLSVDASCKHTRARMGGGLSVGGGSAPLRTTTTQAREGWCQRVVRSPRAHTFASSQAPPRRQFSAASTGGGVESEPGQEREREQEREQEREGTGGEDRAAVSRDTQKLMAIVFTCTKCDTRSGKTFSKQAYEKGVVIVTCGGCGGRHLVADHLGWFGEEGKGTIENWGDVGKGSVGMGEDGTLTYLGDDDGQGTRG